MARCDATDKHNNWRITPLKSLGLAISTLLMFVVGPLVSGWTLSILWGWFIHPVFTAVPSLGVVDAIGISFVARFFLGMLAARPKVDDDRTLSDLVFTGVAWTVVYNGMFLGLGWVLHLLRGA